MVGQKYTQQQIAAIKRIIKEYPNITKRLENNDLSVLASSIQRQINKIIRPGTLKSYIRLVRSENNYYIIPRLQHTELFEAEECPSLEEINLKN
jgi:hypothetical protein